MVTPKRFRFIQVGVVAYRWITTSFVTLVAPVDIRLPSLGGTGSQFLSHRSTFAQTAGNKSVFCQRLRSEQGGTAR